MKELELAGELRKEAEERVKSAAERHGLALKNVGEAEKRLAELPEPPQPSDAQMRAILARKLAEVVQGADRDSIVALLRSAAEWSGRTEFTQAAAAFESGEVTLAAARGLIEEARALSTQAGFWWSVLGGAKLYRTRGFWIVMAALAAIPAVFLLAQKLGMQQGWAHVWTLLGETLTAAGAAIAWARSRLAGASAVFDRLGSLQSSVARSVEEARNADRVAYEKARDAALREETEARARLDALRREEERAAQAERQAREALRESTSQARLGRFIRERASSADYEQHLGLIAMIHRDFRRLSELMEKARLGQADPDLPRVDRIILYIDDLDRCHPPKKVVKVLEAVHLLLFFPLFVVVVGVDSRWVSRSLYKHYEGMLADESMAAAGRPQDVLERAPAESQDFLEKIFQVPFWLRRMEPAAVQRLIHSLISKQELDTAPAVPPPPAVAGAGEAAGAAAPPVEPAAGGQAAGTLADDPARAAAKRATAEAESKPAAADELAAPGESLKITERPSCTTWTRWRR